MKANDAVVTKLTVARLFNLGNYEHERIEVTVEGRGFETSAGEFVGCHIEEPYAVLAELRDVLESCKSPEFGYDEQCGRDIELGTTKVWNGEGEPPDGQWVESNVAALYAKDWEKYKAVKAKRDAALLRLRSLGQVTVNGGGE